MTDALTNMREFSAASQAKRKKLIDGFVFTEPLTRGWILPYLLQLESMAWGRWNYWLEMCEHQQLCAAPIPQIEWESADKLNNPARKMLERCLDGVTKYGDWHGWSGSNYFEYFADWLLFAFGDPSQTEEPKPPGGCEGASERLYQLFDLTPLLCMPHDYFGDILAESGYGKHQGFFPTPMEICQLMTSMNMDGEDMRDKTVCDPCVGTGRMLLCASNHSLRLYGVDILSIMCKVTKINCFLFAPWAAKPLDFLNRSNAVIGLAEGVTAKVAPGIQQQQQLELI